MPSLTGIAARLAHINALLTAGGTDQQVMDWWREHEKLSAELKEAKVAGAVTRATGAKSASTAVPDATTLAGAKSSPPKNKTKAPRKGPRRSVTFMEPPYRDSDGARVDVRPLNSRSYDPELSRGQIKSRFGGDGQTG